MEKIDEKFEFMNIKDPTEKVVLTVYFRDAYPMQIYVTAKIARETIEEWRRFVLYYSKPEIERISEKQPMFTYYFFDGDPLEEERHISAMILFRDISGMIYQQVQREQEKI